jgi:predicted lactoylglutathione lyase
MSIKPRLTLVTLGVSDFACSKRFYEALGWRPSSASQNSVAFFDLNGVVLSLYPRHLLDEDAKVADFRPGFSGVTLAYNAESEAEVDRVFAHALQVGASEVKRPEEVFWGGYSGYFADPDGHLWEVAHNPFFPFDDDEKMVLPK